MKLLSSDYDRTLNTFDYDLMFNMMAIEKFMKEGNIFLLNTGRSYKSIKREIDKYQIDLNYLGCCDGNLVMNSKNEIIHCTNLPVVIYKKLKILESKHLGIRITPIMHHDSILEFEIKMYPVNKEFLKELLSICNDYGLCYKSFDKVELVEFKPASVSYIYLGDRKINKATATKLVGELENIEKCDIFTIGDHHNDLEMIRDFNGYALPWAKQEVKDVSNGVCLSVASLVKKIQRR